MSITNITLIGDALREINVISETDDPSSEQGAYALRKLNQMMELWKEDGIDLGYYSQSSTSAACPIPDWSELGVTTSLAVACAPKYGASISIELAAVAKSTYDTILRKSISEKLDNTDMSHLPSGAGHYGSRYDINTDK